MKKLFALILAIFSVSCLPVLPAKAAFVQGPVDSYGYVDSLTNRWTDDTLDAKDNDAAGDVTWFTPVQGVNMQNPGELQIGGIKKFSSITFSIGNTPLLARQKAKFNFYYPTVQNQVVVYKALAVKDIDGGFALPNRSYKYTFAIPQDWHDMSPHVQSPNMYYIKMACNANCANGLNNGNFQINQILLERNIQIVRLPANNYCLLHPFARQCIPGI